MPTNEERREVARKFRREADNEEPFVTASIVGLSDLNYGDWKAGRNDAECWNWLADLIEPDDDIVHCRECVHFRPENEQKQTPSRCTGVFAFVEPSGEGFCAWGKKVDMNCIE